MYHLKSLHSTIGSQVTKLVKTEEGKIKATFKDLNTHWDVPGWLYFDMDYGHANGLENLFNQFRNAHRRHRWPAATSRVSFAAASKIFGVTAETLKQMTRRELSRLFRQKAMALHPDQGGRQRDFVRLSEAYKSMMQTKR